LCWRRYFYHVMSMEVFPGDGSMGDICGDQAAAAAVASAQAERKAELKEQAQELLQECVRCAQELEEFGMVLN
jgi:hypothetical protein